MQTKIDDACLARVEGVAMSLCATRGNFEFQQAVTATRLDRHIVRACLGLLVRRGRLLAWPGERFAKPIAAPGSSWPTDLRLPIAALMGVR